jgi:hypothetical protein
LEVIVNSEKVSDVAFCLGKSIFCYIRLTSNRFYGIIGHQ